MNKILLVNDCKLESMVMKDMLIDLGYEMYTSNEYGVLSKIKELSPSILICNLLMKETQGNLIIAKVKDVFPNIKCYISSNSNIRLEDYKSNNVDGVIKTPTNISELREILGNINNDVNVKSNIIVKEDSLTNKASKRNIQDLLNKLENKSGRLKSIDSLAENMPKEKSPRESDKILKYCLYCGENIENFEGKLAYCPYCGGKIK